MLPKVGPVHTDKDYHEAPCTSFRLPRLPNSTFPIFRGRSRIQVITGRAIAVGEGEILIISRFRSSFKIISLPQCLGGCVKESILSANNMDSPPLTLNQWGK